MSKRTEFLEVLRVLDAKIGLKINVKETESLRLGVREDGKVKLGTEMIGRVDSFTFLVSIISNDGGWVKENSVNQN